MAPRALQRRRPPAGWVRGVTAWLVVGGGTAGCVVAARLSENAGDHVVLLEAGGPTAPPMASFLDELAAPGATWPGGYPIGRRLGGSSAVNGGVLSGDVRRLGTTLLAAEAAGVDELGPVDRALLAAAPDAEMALLARREGRRVTTADCYLAPAVGRPNLEVRTGVEVDHVLLRGGRAVGVVAVNGEHIDGDRVVLCGGAVQSPVVLLRSGIAVGEPGRGLTDHPGRVIELTLHPEVVVDTGALVTGAVLRRSDATHLAEYVAMNHLGAGRPGTGALLVGLLSGGRHGSVGLDASGAAAAIFDPLSPAVEAALADAVDAGGHAPHGPVVRGDRRVVRSRRRARRLRPRGIDVRERACRRRARRRVRLRRAVRRRCLDPAHPPEVRHLPPGGAPGRAARACLVAGLAVRRSGRECSRFRGCARPDRQLRRIPPRTRGRSARPG